MRFKGFIKKIFYSEKKEAIELFKKVTQEIEDFILFERDVGVSHEKSRQMHYQFQSNQNGMWIEDKPSNFVSLLNRSAYFYFNEKCFKTPGTAININFPFFIDKELKKLKYNDIYIEINEKEKILKKESEEINYTLRWSKNKKFHKKALQIKEKKCPYDLIAKDLKEISVLFDETIHFFINFIKNKGSCINKDYLSQFVRKNKNNKNLLLLALFSSQEEYQKDFVDAFVDHNINMKKNDIYQFFNSLHDNIIKTEDNLSDIYIIEHKMKEVFSDMENGFNTFALSNYLAHQELNEKLSVKDNTINKRTKI